MASIGEVFLVLSTPTAIGIFLALLWDVMSLGEFFTRGDDENYHAKMVTVLFVSFLIIYGLSFAAAMVEYEESYSFVLLALLTLLLMLVIMLFIIEVILEMANRAKGPVKALGGK